MQDKIFPLLSTVNVNTQKVYLTEVGALGAEHKSVPTVHI